MKKTMLVALLASSMLFNVACTEEELAAGIIGVGVGIGLASGSDHDDDYDHGHRPPPRHHGPGHGRPGHDRPGYGRPDYDRPGYGRPGYERPGYGRPGYGHPGNGRPHRGYSLVIRETIRPKSSSAQLRDFAGRYNVSLTAAAKIKNAFVGVESKGIASFENIGLKKSDLKDIVNREMPDNGSLKEMATKLDLSQAQARDLVKVLISDFDAEAKNIESPYWQSCLAKGQWKTPQNKSCKDTSTSGCAPVTGATLCY